MEFTISIEPFSYHLLCDELRPFHSHDVKTFEKALVIMVTNRSTDQDVTNT